ncbi:MAG TPA: phytanoyl-CoA dioxygenase family protein [Chloroflexota bacterium]|nr:phytanoyl-CoA dioxygenase family protein [Chloroflexota bacterium]
MRLTEPQVHHFATFGFLIFRQLFSPAEMGRYLREMEAGLEARRQDLKPEAAEKAKARPWSPLLDERTPFIASLVDDPRFAAAAEQLAGKPMLPWGADGNVYAGDTKWHPDAYSLGYAGVKFLIYADPLNATNGALRVIPGSHREPFHSQVSPAVHIIPDVESVYGVREDQLPCFVFDSRPGDVLAFNVGLWHSSFGGSGYRRMGTVMFYEDPATPEATAAVTHDWAYAHRNYSSRYHGQFYPASWRARHPRQVKRMAELGVLDTPGAEA